MYYRSGRQELAYGATRMRAWDRRFVLTWPENEMMSWLPSWNFDIKFKNTTPSVDAYLFRWTLLPHFILIRLEMTKPYKGDTCSRNLYTTLAQETWTDARDQNCAVWLVGCVWEFLVQETCSCTEQSSIFCSVQISCTSIWYKFLEHITPIWLFREMASWSQSWKHEAISAYIFIQSNPSHMNSIGLFSAVVLTQILERLLYQNSLTFVNFRYNSVLGPGSKVSRVRSVLGPKCPVSKLR